MDHDTRPFVTATYTNTPEDLDSFAEPIVEVSVLWGDQVLDVQHLEPPYSFALQSEHARQSRASAAGSFLLPEAKLGHQRVELVTSTPRGPVILLDGLPSEAEVFFTEHGAIAAAELVTQAHSLGNVHEGRAVWLLTDEITEVRLRDIRIFLSVTTAAKRVPRALFTPSDGHDLAYFGLSFLSAAGVLASAAFFSPPLSLTAAEGLDRNDLILMQQYLDAAAEREEERKIEVGQTDDQAQARRSRRTRTKQRGRDGRHSKHPTQSALSSQRAAG